MNLQVPTLFVSLACSVLSAGTPVQNEKAAVEIARPALIAKFGKGYVAQFEPYRAVDKGNVWIVFGTLPSRRVRGGTPEARIAYADGKVLQVSHGR
ncbi:MAG: YbbC/YhhH family protein [Holophagaceae bacterium]|nr:YbbC/YhhH family protein [Holophagaceae bacterium]